MQADNAKMVERVCKLEAQGPGPSREVDDVKYSLVQLDLANRRLVFVGLGEQNMIKMMASITGSCRQTSKKCALVVSITSQR